MTYINRVGYVSVPEDLWADMMQATRQLLELTEAVAASWGSQISPENQQILSRSRQEWAEVLQRAREVDATHRRIADMAAQSTRDQIERGGDGQPYN